MGSVESPVEVPAPGWGRRFPVDAKIFVWLVLVSVVVMSAFTIGWIFLGRQNVPTDFKTTTPTAWSAKVAAFQAKYTGKDGRVHVPVGQDAYMMALRYAFYPELSLKAGHPYRIWISSADVLHGFSLVGGGQRINLEIAPNHAYGATFTPEKAGKYLIVCNEFCGLQHERMQGFLYVEK
jgi:cytochrome c oxidase subunit 2